MSPQRFTFDTVFDLDGGAYHPPRPKRQYTPEEVEAIRAEAYAEGQTSVVARAEADAAAALNEVAQLIRASLSTLSEVAHSHRSGSAELAMAAARRIADAALEQFPEAPAVAALEALAREVEAAPRLLVFAAPADAPRLEKALAAACLQAGFAGQLVLKPEPGRRQASFVFDWGEGRATFDPAAAADRVAKALDTALAVEGLHAEVVVPHSAEL